MEAAELLRAVSSGLFEHELWGWYTGPSMWPEDRSGEAFDRWFRWSFHSMVYDLSGEPIEHDDEDEDTAGE